MITIKKFKDTMQDVYSTSVCEDTIANINDTVTVLGILAPIYNFKAKG